MWSPVLAIVCCAAVFRPDTPVPHCTPIKSYPIATAILYEFPVPPVRPVPSTFHYVTGCEKNETLTAFAVSRNVDATAIDGWTAEALFRGFILLYPLNAADSVSAVWMITSCNEGLCALSVAAEAAVVGWARVY